MKKAAGFTLVEIIVVIGILVIVFFLGLEVVSSFQRAMSKQSARATEIVFQTAARMAREGEKGTAWGVYVPYDEVSRRSDNMIIFSGTSYATRDTTRDIVYPISRELKFISFKDDPASSGNDHEIVFSYLTGATITAVEINLEYSGGAMVVTIPTIGFAVSEPL